MIWITVASLAGVLIGHAAAAGLGLPGSGRETAAAGMVVFGAGVASLLMLGRLRAFGPRAMALGQLALTAVRILFVLSATGALILLGGLEPARTALGVCAAYLLVVWTEAACVARLVNRQTPGPTVQAGVA
ncbi:MAG: hypothetical protein R3236_08195 [Phycisphaeraceae bacterium]|nr:hypothetical protein [Phycisphaeraceae bacterium]